MTPRAPFVLLALAIAACAPGRTVEAPAPEPARTEPAAQPQSTPPVAQPPAVQPPAATPPRASDTPLLREAPRDWQLLDDSTDRVLGIGVLRAERELLAGKTPARTVIVAVIDGGVDTAHVDLRANLWRNEKEIAGNGRDDDDNGYVDDVRGWSFIGGRGGRSVHQDTYEVTRLYVQCVAGAQGTGRSLSVADRQRCDRITQDFEQKRSEGRQMLEQLRAINAALAQAVPLLKRAAGVDSLTTERVATLRPTSPEVRQARDIYLQLAAIGVTPTVARKAEEQYRSRVEYGLNPSFDPRPIVGDDYGNVAERRYGNADVMGPDAEHGTHVAGIIGAVRGNGVGVDGIAPAVRIMAIRAVPDGDERDKDVANAIRYAVDHGAHIINMSFGKAYSPHKSVVDEAVKYADARGVLMVHAAGNDAEDAAQNPSYPTPAYLTGGRARNWIEVGASSWKGLDSLAAPFSNYGREQVDVFAPGVDILSTVPGDRYEPNSGTSMAAPVVSGLAALLMAYYPTLTAADVRRIIIASATRRADIPVLRPGASSGERVPFGTLSVTGGVVNAYAAIRMAEAMR